MKRSHAITLAAAALAVGFFAAHWCFAQPSKQPPAKEPTNYGFGALQQMEDLVAYLNNTKQTNTLQRFYDYMNASLASRHYADLVVTLAILQRLRDGRTNEALELFEGRLSTDVVGFAMSYRELPASSLRDQGSLKALEWAKEYFAKHPPQHHAKVEDDALANAFKILDKK